jgi:hypothetical protein
VVNATPQQLYHRERELLSLMQEVGWSSGTVWTGENTSPPTRIPTLDSAICSESPHRLTHFITCTGHDKKETDEEGQLSFPKAKTVSRVTKGYSSQVKCLRSTQLKKKYTDSTLW